jgi:hypothetical protein
MTVKKQEAIKAASYKRIGTGKQLDGHGLEVQNHILRNELYIGHAVGDQYIYEGNRQMDAKKRPF